uniref:Glutaredoxin putative n=1 Tax=Albugo laibachii Nc14 TaxID=890382 RepID=F0X022_9STRA|nr:glutaredoxin putative [Albugo laibachii Nc14]|eukprot:CCA27104.1 glutaredoxin putative [Albugo laibachii Nc14]
MFRTGLRVHYTRVLQTRRLHIEPSKSFIQTLISDPKSNLVFSKTYCPYASQVKDLLNTLCINYETIELDKRDDGARIQEILTELTGQRTVPNVFLKGKHIGGCDDTLANHKAGKLI